jgi:aryl-alcohol dehydrogenase-like predicted oxidoreductase
MGLGRDRALALSAALCLLSLGAQAAPFQSATIRRIVDGKQVYIDAQQARVNQTAGKGQNLSTGNSRSELLFDRRALGFLGRNSQIRLGQECFRLSAGTVLINGPERACLGSKVLGVRGTTYVLSKQPDQTYELAVLTGEAELTDASAAVASTAGPQDILQRYPSISPVVGLGSSAYGSNAGGLGLGQAAGLILGNLSFFTPLWQEQSSRLAYSYTTANSNFGGFWGASSEVGYRWFDPNNQANSGLLVGYDGWQQPSCFHSQVALGAEWERNRWQLSAQGGIPIAACNDSLKRLHTEYIDIYYSHHDDQEVPMAETLGAYAQLISEGKVRYIAASQHTGARLQEALNISQQEGLPSYIALQDHYNLMERNPFESEQQAVLANNGLSALPFYSLARGFLSGKYRPGVTVDSVRAEGVKEYQTDKGWAVVAALDEIAKAHNSSVSAIALAWLRSNPQVSTPIASARTVEQLIEIIEVVHLSEFEVKKLNAASA